MNFKLLVRLLLLTVAVYLPASVGAQGPLNVTPTLDSSHAATHMFRAALGGTLTTSGADGTVFTLTIPANALLSDESITMTPMLSVDGLPVSGGFVAGVQLEPDGLRLFRPATLTIQPPVPVPVDQQAPFSYHSSGQDFSFYPLAMGSGITFNLVHFSGEGLGQGSQTQSFTPNDPESGLQNQAAQLINQERACPGCDPQFQSKLQALFQQYFDQVVVPLINQALTDDSVAVSAIAQALAWARQIELLGLAQTPPFDMDEQFILQSLPPILANGFNKAYGRCQNDTAARDRMTEFQTMLGVIRSLALMGNEDPSGLIPNYKQKLAACALGRLKLDFDSQADGTNFSIVNGSAHVQASNAMLTLDQNTFQYSAASVPLQELSVTYSPSDAQDCSIVTPGVGTTDVKADIDLNLGIGVLLKPPDVRVYLNPLVLEIFTPGFSDDAGCHLATTLPTELLYDPFWKVAHLDPGTPFLPYTTVLNTPQAINFSGSLGPAASTETGTITVSQVDP